MRKSIPSPEIPLPERVLLRAREAAATLGVSDRTLWSLAKAGQVPTVRIGRRVGFRPEDLKAFVAAGGTK